MRQGYDRQDSKYDHQDHDQDHHQKIIIFSFCIDQDDGVRMMMMIMKIGADDGDFHALYVRKKVR